MKLPKALSALPFAHLLGMSAARAEDDEMKQGADESDEDYAKRLEEKEEEENDASADDDDEKDDGADDEKDNGEKKGKKAKKAEEPDDEKEKAARVSERARCAAIFKCEAAGVRPDVAAHLAFSTDMSSSAAISMLKSFAAGTPTRAGGLANRMAAVKAPVVGASAGAAPAANSPQGVAARIIAAGNKRRGEA